MNQHFYFIWLLSFCCGASLANGFHPRISLSIAREMVPVESFRNCFVPSEDQRSCLDWPMNPVGPPGPQNSSDTLLSLVDINQGLVTDSHSISDSPSSPVDVNQGLVTDSESTNDMLLSLVDAKQSLISNFHSISDSPLSPVDVNQGLVTDSERKLDSLLSQVDVNQGLITESRFSDEVSVASERQTSSQQERRFSDEVSVASERQTSPQRVVPQYDTSDFVSEDASKTNSNEVSLELGYLISFIGAQEQQESTIPTSDEVRS